MKTQAQIKEELLISVAKINDAITTGKGYASFSRFRAEKTKVKTLAWVLGLSVEEMKSLLDDDLLEEEE